MPKPSSNREVIKITPISDPDSKVYPRSIKGFYTRWRWGCVWLTQLVFYGLCWVTWNGRQAILFDLDKRKFYLFDLVLWPQDTIYLVFLMILGALTLFCLLRSRGVFGVDMPVRKPCTRKYLCGSRKSLRAIDLIA